MLRRYGILRCGESRGDGDRLGRGHPFNELVSWVVGRVDDWAGWVDGQLWMDGWMDGYFSK